MQILEGGFKGLANRFIRFSLVGVIISISSISISTFLLAILKTNLYYTYVGMYLISLAASYLLNARYTFKAKKDVRSGLLYFINYGISFVFGLFLLKVFRSILPYENYIIGLMPIPFQLLWNFGFSHFIFRKDE